MLLGPSFRSEFVFNINSFILSGFPSTSFHLLNQASLSAFTWINALMYAVVQKYNEISLVYDYSCF